VLNTRVRISGWNSSADVPNSTTWPSLTAQMRSAGQTVIELKAVRKDYSSEVTIGPVDLQIPKGGVTALVGPNGAGKSTLLTIIGRLTYRWSCVPANW